MDFLLSVGRRSFYPNLTLDWTEKILQYDVNDNVAGCEIYINFEDEEEIDYIAKLLCNPSTSHWKYQFHAPELFDGLGGYTYYLGLLQYYNHISDLLGYTVKVNFHPIEPYEIFEAHYAVTETIKELHKIFDIIDRHNFNVEICIENLNLMHGHRRCGVNDLVPVLELPKVYFTWDVGHEVKDNTCKYTLNKLSSSKLRNIHIHDTSEISDHSPFYYNAIDLSTTFDFLKSINYENAVVAEIGLNLLNSNTFDEQLEEYVRNIDILAQSYKVSQTKRQTDSK